MHCCGREIRKIEHDQEANHAPPTTHLFLGPVRALRTAHDVNILTRSDRRDLRIFGCGLRHCQL